MKVWFLMERLVVVTAIWLQQVGETLVLGSVRGSMSALKAVALGFLKMNVMRFPFQL